MRVDPQELGLFEIEVNGVPQCTAAGEMNSSGADTQQATCGAIALLVAGNKTLSSCLFLDLCLIHCPKK